MLSTTRTFHVTEIDIANGCKHVAYHKFDLPNPGEQGFYRSTTSFNSFFYSSKMRNRKGKTTLFYAKDGEELMYWGLEEGTPVIEYANIWDFYKAIGYDYKSKKYLAQKEE